MPNCQRCGASVTSDYVRVMSADGDSVYGCPDCEAVPAGRSHLISLQDGANHDQSRSASERTRLEGWR